MGPRLCLPGSIRFRLTAWYALLLALVLAILGFSILRLTEDRLRLEMEDRLGKTAESIYATIGKMDSSILLGGIERKEGKPFSFRGTMAFRDNLRVELQEYTKRGSLIQVVDASDGVIARSMSAPEEWSLVAREESRAPDRLTPLTVRVEGVDVRVVRRPAAVKENGQEFTVGGIIVGERLDDLQSTMDALQRTLLATSIAGLALAIAGGWLLAGRALKPVDRVTAAAAQIARGDGTAASLTTRLSVPDTGDEIARLSGTFNAMLDRLESSFRSQQRFVADASHELRTPLTAIRGNVEVLGRQLAALDADRQRKGDLEAGIADVQRESARMGRLVDDLLFLVRTDAPAEGTPARARPVRLDEIARDAVRTSRALATGQKLAVVAPAPVGVAGDADRLQQLLLILLDNALRHTPAGKAVTVEVAAAGAPGAPGAAGLARLVVRDEGEGIAPEHLPHLFDRFYRADGARGRATGGTGLGLAIARAIVRAHGGEIAVDSAPGTGTTFAVSLPAVRAPAGLPAPAPAPEVAAVPRPGEGTEAVARTG